MNSLERMAHAMALAEGDAGPGGDFAGPATRAYWMKCAEVASKFMEPANTFDVLEGLVAAARCKPGWSFRLVDEDGALRLVIRVEGTDSSRPGDNRRFTVDHYHPVPTATYNAATWRRWIFEQCRRVENHELGEWLRWGDERPFAPLHGPGEDPYTVHEFRPESDALTTQDGSVREPYREGEA